MFLQNVQYATNAKPRKSENTAAACHTYVTSNYTYTQRTARPREYYMLLALCDRGVYDAWVDFPERIFCTCMCAFKRIQVWGVWNI